MSAVKDVGQLSVVPRSGYWAGRAWLAVALIPVFFVMAFALGYPLYDLLGYKPENDDAPLWVDLFCTAVILAVALVPCVASMYFGRRAAGSGDRRGVLPFAVGAAAGLGVAIMSVVGLIA